MVTDIVGKFAHINSDSYEDYGLPRGQLVFIVGSGFSPVDEDDTYKLLFIIAKMDGDVPSKERGVTIARKSLEVLPDEQSDELLNRMEESLAQLETKEKIRPN